MLQEVGTDRLAIPLSPYTAAYNIIDSCTKSDELWDFMTPFVAQSGVHVSELVQRHNEKLGHRLPYVPWKAPGSGTANVVEGLLKAPKYQSPRNIRAMNNSRGRGFRRFKVRERMRVARHWFNVGMDFLIDV